MPGTFTPDSLSRESSPIPEIGGGGDADGHPTGAIITHPQIIAAQNAVDLCRISQSAPVSPSGKFLPLIS